MVVVYLIFASVILITLFLLLHKLGKLGFIAIVLAFLYFVLGEGKKV